MASAGARAYNGGQGAEPPPGVQGQNSPGGVRGSKAPEADVISNASATVFARNDVLFELLLLI